MRDHRIVQALGVALLAACVYGHSAAQQPAEKAPAPPSDFLEAVNETQGTVKLEYLVQAEGSRQPVAQAATCVNPGATVRWSLGSSQGGTIRMQMMRGNQCDDRQVACRSEMPRAAGSMSIALRGEGSKCVMAPMAPRQGEGLKAAGDCGPSGKWAPLTIENEFWEYSIWITFYKIEPSPFYPNKIIGSGCWLPREKRMACVDRAELLVRAEVKCAGRGQNGRCVKMTHCGGSTVADTGRDWRFGNRGGPFRVDMNRWSNGYYLSNDPHVMFWWR